MLTLLLAIPISISPQTVGGGLDLLVHHPGTVDEGRFGYQVSGAGDMNNDGFDDYLITEMHRQYLRGTVRAYSGADGALLYQWSGEWGDEQFGSSLSALGDVNGDGFDDVLIGAREMNNLPVEPAVGAAFVFSGANGSMIFEWKGQRIYDDFGCSVAGAGDVNLDGIPDILVGAQEMGPFSPGMVFLYSGADGSEIRNWSGNSASEHFGAQVANAGDVNADGIPDHIIGSPRSNGYGRVIVISGESGQLLFEWTGAAWEDEFGSSVSGIGDLNADGYDDVMVGAYGVDDAGFNDAGQVSIFSGADGSLLRQWHGWRENHRLGYQVANMGDFTGDGINDVLVGNNSTGWWNQTRGWAYLFDGDTGEKLYAHGGGAKAEFGISLANVGDINGDGRMDAIIGSPRTNEFGVNMGGAAFLLGYSPFLEATTDQLSIGAGGRVDFTLNFPGSVAWQPYRLLASATGTGPIQHGIEIPLSYDHLLQRTNDGAIKGMDDGFWYGNLDGNAAAQPFLRVRPNTNSFAIGKTIYIAGVAMNANGWPRYSSAAVSLTFLP
jgi:hypothetical protein